MLSRFIALNQASTPALEPIHPLKLSIELNLCYVESFQRFFYFFNIFCVCHKKLGVEYINNNIIVAWEEEEE